MDRRFGGIARLYGTDGLARLQNAHVCVIGVGGVGSWVVEALARNAVGTLTLIDLDNVAESNINRQIQALSNTLGQAKISALAERITLINPSCNVIQIEDFITPENIATVIDAKQFDYIIDAIDNARAKAALIAYCKQHHIKLITIGSAGGQIDPTKISICDLSQTKQDPLLAKVRRLLRKEYGFPNGEKNKFKVEAVFSSEQLRMPINDNACDITQNDNPGVHGLNCAGFGSTMVVTATFGLIATAHVLRILSCVDNI